MQSDATEDEEGITNVSPLSDEHYAAIGRAAESWAALEMGLDLLCWELAMIRPDIGACFTAQVIGPGRKFDALMSLVRLRGGGDALIADLNKFIAKAHGLAERRNRIVHDPWRMGDTGVPERYEITARKTLNFRSVAVPTAEIEKLHDEVEDHMKVFQKIRETAHALLLLNPEE